MAQKRKYTIPLLLAHTYISLAPYTKNNNKHRRDHYSCTSSSPVLVERKKRPPTNKRPPPSSRHTDRPTSRVDLLVGSNRTRALATLSHFSVHIYYSAVVSSQQRASSYLRNTVLMMVGIATHVMMEIIMSSDIIDRSCPTITAIKNIR